jgi:hypothetical protein
LHLLSQLLHFLMMARFICALAGFSLAAGGAVELGGHNFDQEVFQSGKNAFVKFLAPW